jgi:hypothetical protein
MPGWRPPTNKSPAFHTSVGRPSRKRSFPWSRRPNGFSDNPKWRAVAACSGLDLCTVLAFVNRLEELGNDAANRGEIRGCVTEFKAHDFAAALDISAEDANKLYISLERPDIGWIADGMIVDFHDRNPDLDDPTALERQRRKRSRDKIHCRLGELARTGIVSADERLEIENRLSRLDHAGLIDLQAELEAKSIQTSVTRDPRMSRRDSVTLSIDHIEASSSARSDAQDVTRDNVTVTPDQNRQYKTTQNATISGAASAELAGLAEEEKKIGLEVERDAVTWLEEKGSEMIMDRMGEPQERAMARLSGWSEQVHDRAELVEILRRAQNHSGHGFHMEVTDQIRRLAH